MLSLLPSICNEFIIFTAINCTIIAFKIKTILFIYQYFDFISNSINKNKFKIESKIAFKCDLVFGKNRNK